MTTVVPEEETIADLFECGAAYDHSDCEMQSQESSLLQSQ